MVFRKLEALNFLESTNPQKDSLSKTIGVVSATSYLKLKNKKMKKTELVFLDLKFVAKFLNINLIGWQMGRNILLEHLRNLQILQEGKNKNRPYIHYYQLGFFETITVMKNDRSHKKTVITEKGLNWLMLEKRSIIEENEIAYWKDSYPKEYAKLMEQRLKHLKRAI